MAENLFKQIKQHLQKEPSIHISGLGERSTSNIKAFMEELFVTHFRKASTIYGNNRIQTERGKRRSFGDIYRIMCFYFPKITVTTTYDTLYQLIGEGKVLSAICAVNHCRVYRAVKDGEKSTVNSVLTDEYKTDLKAYTTKYKCSTQLGSTWGTEYTSDNLEYINF